MKAATSLIPALVFLFSSRDPAIAVTRRVPAQYATIQSAITASINGDTVLVAANIYAEAISFNNKLITVISESGAGSTTINGNNTASAVTFSGLETSSPRLIGFTIAGGNPYGVLCNGNSVPNVEQTVDANSFVARSDGKYNTIIVRDGVISQWILLPGTISSSSATGIM